MDQFIYQPVWEEKPLKSASSHWEKQHWLIGFFGESNTANIVENFKQKDIASTILDPVQLQSLDSAKQLFEHFAKEENLNILLGYEENSEEPLEITEIKAVNSCANLVKAIEEKRSLKRTTLCIATRGTQTVDQQGEQSVLKDHRYGVFVELLGKNILIYDADLLI